MPFDYFVSFCDLYIHIYSTHIYVTFPIYIIYVCMCVNLLQISI